MPKLAFGDLKIAGFKCFVGEHHLMLDKYGPGLHFVRGRNEAEPRLGPNGAGKSSLWDALCWCLYGRTPDGSRNPDIKPWHGSKKTAVSVDLKVNNKGHTVQRTANPNMLTLDGNPVGQEQIESLIGLGVDSFCHTILLGQGQPLFLDLQPRDKMQLFSDVLDLDRWERRSALASERVRQFEQAEAQLFGELAGLENSKINLEKIRAATKAQSAEWEDKHSVKQRADLKRLDDVTRRLTAAQKKHDEIDAKHDWTWTQIKLIDKDLDAAVTEEAYLRQLREARQELASSPKRCPTCDQVLPRSGLSKKLAALDAQIKKASKRSVAASIRDSLAIYHADADSLRAELDMLTPTIATLTAQKNALQRALSERHDEVNPYQQQLSDLRKQLAKLDADMKVTKAEMEKVMRRAERAKFWVKGFKDVRLFLIEEVLQELTLATNAALEDVGLIGWNVSYDVEKETKSGGTQRGLNVMITSPVTKQRVRWESWSGGEGQRLRIVAALALSETLLQYAGVSCDLEILDEPAHFMAPDGVRELCEFLAARAQALGKRTWLVDHMAIDSACFASVTTVVKSKDGARIENA